MLLDAAYAVRKVLADLSLSDARLTGVLLHSTGREPSRASCWRGPTPVPAFANCRHFGRGEGYPGDADIGLPAFAAEIPPFDATRVVHLGDGLNQEEFEQAAENVATVSRPGHRDGGQRVLRLGPRSEGSEMTVRTFGMCRIGRTRKEFVARAADLLCRKTAQRWLGDAHDDNAVPMHDLDHFLRKSRT